MSETSADEEPVRDGPMREEIIRMVIDALNAQGLSKLDRDSIRRDAKDRAAFVEMLEDCRPLPVITQLIEDAREGRI